MSEQEMSEFARRLARGRRQEAKTCAYCGKPISGIAIRRYCSASCRVMASRQRRQGAAADAGGVSMADRLARRRAATGTKTVHDSAVLLRERREEPVGAAVVPLLAQLDALRAESQPLDGCVAELLNEAREEQGAAR